jgi:hypothetical protein
LKKNQKAYKLLLKKRNMQSQKFRSAKPFGKGFHQKAQSAMEYLMTYGWAVLIIAVVLAALFSIGVFSGNTGLGTACTAEVGYLCTNPVLSSTGALQVSFGQLRSVPIVITGTGCSNSTTYKITTTGLNYKVPSGRPMTLVFNCNPLIDNSIGASFSGTLWIQYNILQQTAQLSQVATITAKVAVSGTFNSPGSGGSGSPSECSQTITSYDSDSSIPFSATITYTMYGGGGGGGGAGGGNIGGGGGGGGSSAILVNGGLIQYEAGASGGSGGDSGSTAGSSSSNTIGSFSIIAGNSITVYIGGGGGGGAGNGGGGGGGGSGYYGGGGGGANDNWDYPWGGYGGSHVGGSGGTGSAISGSASQGGAGSTYGSTSSGAGGSGNTGGIGGGTGSTSAGGGGGYGAGGGSAGDAGGNNGGNGYGSGGGTGGTTGTGGAAAQSGSSGGGGSGGSVILTWPKPSSSSCTNI